MTEQNTTWRKICTGIYRVGNLKVASRRKGRWDYWCVITSDDMETPEVYHSKHRKLENAKIAALLLTNPVIPVLPDNIFAFPQSLCDFYPQGKDIIPNHYHSFHAIPKVLLRKIGLDPAELALLKEIPTYSSCIIRANTKDCALSLPRQGDNHLSRMAQLVPHEQRNFRTFMHHGVFTSYCIIIRSDTAAGLSSLALQGAYQQIMRYYGG
jgi:hypothetical protein